MNNENDDQTKDDAATSESPHGPGLVALPCSTTSESAGPSDTPQFDKMWAKYQRYKETGGDGDIDIETPSCFGCRMERENSALIRDMVMHERALDAAMDRESALREALEALMPIFTGKLLMPKEHESVKKARHILSSIPQ